MASARIKNKKNAPMAGLALFYLAFLGGEFLFDERVGALAGASAVALAESVVVGISVAGFLLYPVMLRLAGNRARNVLYVAGGVSAACLVTLGLAGSLGVVYAAGGVGLLCLGLVGAAAHDAIARADEPVGLGAAVGAAYAAGVLLQVGLQLATPGAAPRGVILAAAAVASAGFARAGLRAAEGGVDGEEAGAEVQEGAPSRTLPILADIVALMTCIFSTLNVTLTSMHAAGQVDLGSWPRLFLAASALATGFVLDKLSRRYAPAALALVSTLSCFAIFSAIGGGPAIVSAMVFYLGSGAFVVFFTAAFIIAGRGCAPAGLWPSMGRVVNNVVSLAVAVPALVLVTQANGLATSAVVLVVLAAIYVLVFLGLERGSAATKGSAADLGSGSAPAPAPLDTPADSQTSASLDPAQKLSAFVEAFGLTDREAEVLGALTTSDANMQELAQELYISRSALYRHISSICKRVGVENRQALLLRYFAWEPDARD